MKYIKLSLISLLALSFTGCEFGELGVGGEDLTDAAVFGTCVVKCYENTYGSTTSPEEIPVVSE